MLRTSPRTMDSRQCREGRQWTRTTRAARSIDASCCAKRVPSPRRLPVPARSVPRWPRLPKPPLATRLRRAATWMRAARAPGCTTTGQACPPSPWQTAPSQARLVATGRPSLRVEPAGDYALGTVGSMGVGSDGTLWLSNSDASGSYADPVRTGHNSTGLVSFPPVRILETRPQYAGGKSSMLNPGVVDSNGFIGGGQTLNVSLDALLVWAGRSSRTSPWSRVLSPAI
jgi:hypothetical protein